MKNKHAQELGKLSAESRDTSSEAMRVLVNKRWEKQKKQEETLKRLLKDERVQKILNEYLNDEINHH